MVDIHVVGDKGLFDLSPDAPYRIQIAHRILRYKSHFGSAQPVVVLLLQAGDLLAIKLDGAADHMARARQKPQHCHG